MNPAEILRAEKTSTARKGSRNAALSWPLRTSSRLTTAHSRPYNSAAVNVYGLMPRVRTRSGVRGDRVRN